MALYEHIFMVRQDASNAQVETLTQQFRTVIEENGGSIEKHEYWGVKPLAYKVRKNRKAHFTLVNISAPHAAVAEMERQMTLSDDVIRFLTLRVDEHEEGPSVMMRDDRPRRDNRPPRKPAVEPKGENA
jgi:small subunit ribosomal protein S6